MTLQHSCNSIAVIKAFSVTHILTTTRKVIKELKHALLAGKCPPFFLRRGWDSTVGQTRDQSINGKRHLMSQMYRQFIEPAF